MQEENYFLKGMFWGTTISIPLWISFVGWMKIMMNVVKVVFG